MKSLLTLGLVVLAAAAFFAGRRRAIQVVGGRKNELRSRPVHYGIYMALWCVVPAAFLLLISAGLEPLLLEARVSALAPEEMRLNHPERIPSFVGDVASLASGRFVGRDPTPGMQAAAAQWSETQRTLVTGVSILAMGLALAGYAWARSRIQAGQRARDAVERVLLVVLAACSTLAILTTLGIVLSLVFEAARFFSLVSVVDFLFGIHWSPQTALRPDQVGSTGAFGAVPIFAGTLLITGVAMAVAFPVGLFSAIYLAEYASSKVRGVVKPMLEMLAGIPTVVYGFFAALTVGPAIRGWGESVGLSVSSESALAAGLIMGVMIIPFVSSLSDDVITAVPQSLREGALGLGATPSEMIRQVVLPAALPGIVAAVLLAISRAIGETMIVVMAAGLAANLTANPLEAVTTVTVQIVTLLVGDQEFDSAKTLAAFALGLVLFVVTLVLNVVALYVVRRYREQYE